MSQYMEAISKLPRAAKWGAGGLLVLVFYFFVAEPTIDRMNRLNVKADSSEANLNKFAASNDPQKHALDTLALGTRQYGDVEFPGDPATRSVAFNEAVNKILEAQKVAGPKSRTKTAPLGAGPLTSKIGSDQRVERMVRDIEFDATPEEVAGVVAALERCPVVATVSKVQLRVMENKDKSARLVHAVVTAEAWQIAPKKG